MQIGDKITITLPAAKRPMMTLGQFWHACRCANCRRTWARDYWRWIIRAKATKEQWTVVTSTNSE